MHLPLHTSSKHEGLFNCFSSVNKKYLLYLFCGIPVKIGKMFINSYIFINFVLFSSGKTKFSMASCMLYIYRRPWRSRGGYLQLRPGLVRPQDRLWELPQHDGPPQPRAMASQLKPLPEPQRPDRELLAWAGAEEHVQHLHTIHKWPAPRRLCQYQDARRTLLSC